jgi:ribosome biogenesis GTPase
VYYFYLQSPETSLGFLDRFLACCEAYNIPVLILFNKIDLLNFEEVEIVEELQEMYENLGYQTLQVSSEDKLNLDKLQKLLKIKRLCFSDILVQENLLW